MDNYHYLKIKPEYPLNQDKLFLQINKNCQNQNIFRIDSNMNKQKGKIYNLNNKKEIHFTTRIKDNENSINGPKMLTMNFPPGFMITDNNNNSRKNVSHEKNLFLQKNIANNMELNEIGSDNEKIFSNTVQTGFQDYSEKKNNYKDKKQEKFNNLEIFNKNNSKNKNVFYTSQGSTGNGFNSNENTNYIKSKKELKRNSSSENNYEIVLNNIRTEGSDYDNHYIISNGGIVNNNNRTKINPFISLNHQNNRITSIIDSDLHNNYSSNTSNNSKDKYLKSNNSSSQKNIYSGERLSNNNTKLVLNPSNITNQIMIKKNSDSELYDLYIGNNKYNKELKQLNNKLSYNNRNQEFNNNYIYQKNNNYIYNYNILDKPLKLSPRKGNNSNSISKDKNHIKTQSDFDKKSRINYYENLINDKYQIGEKINIKKENLDGLDFKLLKKFSIRKKVLFLNIGIAYKIHNEYKFYFNIPNGEIYILKEYDYNFGKELIPLINKWNEEYKNNNFYLKIYGHEINSNQRQIIIIMQYPSGGESLNDIINSVGFYDHNILFHLVTKFYQNIKKIKDDKNNQNYKNIPFCLCDIFINVNEDIKIVPPLVRKFQNFEKNKNLCNCKSNILLLQNLFNINEEYISFFCLGFLIIQIITQNFIFELNSYKYIIKKLKINSHKNNINNINSYKNNNFLEKNCCLAHLLLDIEEQNFNGNEHLLFSHFLNLYPNSLLSFLHECTNFRNDFPSSSNAFLNLYDTYKNLNLSIKEILEVIILPKNECIKFDTFLSDFELLFKDIKINSNNYIDKLIHNRVIEVLSRAFDIDKEQLMNEIRKKTEENENKFNS